MTEQVLCEVYVDGTWWPGVALAWYRSADRWRVVVRWSRGPGDRYQGAFWGDQVRRLTPGAQPPPA